MRQYTDKKKKRQLHIKKASAFLLIGMLALICLANLISRDRKFSDKENRMLEQKPQLSLAGIESGRFMKQYESYKSDQFAGRSLWASLKTGTDLLMGKRDSNGVFKGRKSYLLEDITRPDKVRLQNNLDAIKEFQKAYPDTPLYMMLVPNAANVMSDKLPALAETFDQRKELREIKKYLGSGINWIDAQAALDRHKNEKIYYHTDHHWTTLGAYYAYQELAASMKLDTSKAPDWKPYAISNDFNGTLAATSGYEQGYREPVYIYLPSGKTEAPEVVVNYVDEKKKTAVLYDAAKLKERDQYAIFLGGNYSQISIRTTADATDRLLLVKDSYANCLVPFLTPYYREIIMIDPRYYYGDIHKVMKENKITSVLFLYNGNTFLEDNSISGVLKNGTTE